MKFYNRVKELNDLNNVFTQSNTSARMTVITGRRRIGKTLLSVEFTKDTKFVYLFVSKKSENLLCREYISELKKVFDIPVIGNIRKFKDVFALIMEISKNNHFTLIIDEFQEFFNINSSVYSEVQNIWDMNKDKCKLNLILIGSIYSLMNKIFQNSKEPLFGRADRILYLEPFSIKTINQILFDQNKKNIQTLFDFYLLTGGMPKYIDIAVTNSVFSFNSFVNFILQENSPFLYEGKNLLIEEFGKEYATYFSILELISIGKTARPEIESILEQHVGGYLERLEKDYSIITKHKPINAKPQSRLQKYKIGDNFLNFWFRFIYRNRSAIETNNFKYVKDIIRRDYTTYCGPILEKFFQQLFADSGKYNRVGSYWEKGNKNEIDLVAVNDLKKEIAIAEIKLKKSKINLNIIKQKAERIFKVYSDYQIDIIALGLEDAKNFI